MKKIKIEKRLSLNKETIAVLNAKQLDVVKGGDVQPTTTIQQTHVHCVQPTTTVQPTRGLC
jgi:hypothetical protein